MTCRLGLILLSGLLLLAGLPQARPAAPPAPVKIVPADHAKKMAQGRELFAKHIRAVFIDRCLKCHGGDKTRGELDLATHETLLTGGESGKVVIPGKAAASKLYKLVAHLEKPYMPSTGKALTREQVANIARWIDLGAPYDKPLIERKDRTKKEMVVTAEDRRFWSFRPLSRPQVPAVKNASWASTPIDRFILAQLEAKGLTPAKEASRRTLIRRVYFDLIGLPPTPREVDAFLNDKRPGAYERVVDRLLASPAYGERWGRHWLDLARFAESHGFEHDYDRPTAYPYRDFVIKALNLDLPYDTFAKWQIAGDEFEPKNPLALTATGFLGAGVHSTQITANTVEKERYDELDDIVRTMGTAMLGLTVGCARCHDHKYDPIPTRDYYRLVSTFTTTVRGDIDIEVDPDRAKKALAEHQKELATFEKVQKDYEGKTLPSMLDRWLKTRKKGQNSSAWAVVEPKSLKSSGGATFVRQADGSYLASGKNARFDTYTVVIHTTQTDIRALRLEALAHPSMVKGGPGRAGNGNFALSDVKLTATPLKGGKAVPVKFSKARATFEQKGLPVSATIDKNPNSSWAVDPQFGKNHAAVFDLETPIGVNAGLVLTLTLSFRGNTGHNIGRPRFSLTSQANAPAVAGDGLPAEVQAIFSKLDQNLKLSDKERHTLSGWYRGMDPGWAKLNNQITALKKRGPRVERIKAMICSEGIKPIRLHSQGGDFLKETHFLKRGDSNQKNGVATQGFLQVLMRSKEGEKRWQVKPPAGTRSPYLRRSLANWIGDVEEGAGHLLARVIVNRLWQHHFGKGIVNTPSDFGLQGDRPTHPELLDWLASEVVAQGWRLKPLHRTIVLSAAYRQGTTFDKEKAARDPDNRLWWRRTPRRLEAEVIRDGMLAVAGQLDRRMFGPGTLDVNQSRRSMYFFVKRSQLIPMMLLFDAPDGVVGIEQRTTTTIAPQALLLMNNALVRRSSEAFAARLALHKTSEDTVKAAYLLALGRPPTKKELASSLEFLKEQRQGYEDEKKADAARLALTDFCQVILGLNEFVYVD